MARGGRGPPKSRAGERPLSLPAALVRMLAAHLSTWGLTGANESSLVFTTPDGDPLDYSNWRSRVWLPAVQHAGVPSAGLHDLRRTNATQLVVTGVDIKTAQSRLGHADPRLTLAVYAQSVDTADRQAAAKRDERFFGRPTLAPYRDHVSDWNIAVVQIDPGRDGINGDAAGGPHPDVPFQAIDDLRRRYLGPDRRAGQGRRNTSPSGEDAIFQAAGFLPEERVGVADARVLDRTTDDLVAWVFSASSTAPHLFGNQLARFEADLRALLDDASRSGHFSVPLSDTTLRIRRPDTTERPRTLPGTGGKATAARGEVAGRE